MSNLKDLRLRRKAIISTKKITKAVGMIAASKLKKNREIAEKYMLYAEGMYDFLQNLIKYNISDIDNLPLLKAQANSTYLLVIISSNRGLCGGFNMNLIKFVKSEIKKYQNLGKEIKIVCIGIKGYEILKSSEYSDLIIKHYILNKLTYERCFEVRDYILNIFEKNEFDHCNIYYNQSKNLIIQEAKMKQIIPAIANESEEINMQSGEIMFEPKAEVILEKLLPVNINVQIFNALLESATSEEKSRMTAMDQATRNANDIIEKLALKINRSRQEMITTELIEIIASAEIV